MDIWLGAYVEDEVNGNGYEIEKDDEREDVVVRHYG